MRLVSWNLKKGLNKNKTNKLLELLPDIALLQESYHPKEFENELRSEIEDAIWVGADKPKGLGLCIVSFSKDYKITLLDTPIKYEWIVPIKISGKENFTLIAVWTKRMTGFSYGKVLYSALQEYQHFINGPVVVMGDFNFDKRVTSSYTGVGYKPIIQLFENLGLKSCYHSISGEDFGLENRATYYHHGKYSNPFHIDYCFVSQDVYDRIQHFYIGLDSDYLPLSDHLPLVLDFTLGVVNSEDEIVNNNKTIITTEN